MTDLDFKAIGLKIKERRKQLGETQEHIANMLEVNSSHVSNIECGRANPSLTALVKIANALKCHASNYSSHLRQLYRKINPTSPSYRLSQRAVFYGTFLSALLTILYLSHIVFCNQ